MTLVIVGAVVTPLVGDLLRPTGPTVSEQLDRIAAQASADYLHARIRQARLRSDGRRSWIVLTRDPRFTSNTSVPASDAIKIFDADGSGDHAKLTEAFDFRPRQEGGYLPWLFDVSRIADLDGDGNVEILGTLRERTSAHPARVPTVIRWNPLHQRYEVRGLIELRPRLQLAPFGDGSSYWQQIERHRFVLTDPVHHQRMYGYAAEAFDVIPPRVAGADSVAVAAYQLRALGGEETWQLAGFRLDLEYDARYESQCGYPPRTQVVPGARLFMTDDMVLPAWRRNPLLC